MYCHQCGAQVADEAKFCSGCGRTIDAAQLVQRGQSNMATHVSVLAWLFIGSAILYALVGISLIVAPSILRNLPIPTPPDVPFDIVQFITSIAGLVGTIILAFGAINAAAGVGLLQYQSWGRTLALVMSAIDLIKIPFGTALGIYGFWVLLSERGRSYYDQQSTIAEGRTRA